MCVYCYYNRLLTISWANDKITQAGLKDQFGEITDITSRSGKVMDEAPRLTKTITKYAITDAGPGAFMCKEDAHTWISFAAALWELQGMGILEVVDLEAQLATEKTPEEMLELRKALWENPIFQQDRERNIEMYKDHSTPPKFIASDEEFLTSDLSFDELADKWEAEDSVDSVGDSMKGFAEKIAGMFDELGAGIPGEPPMIEIIGNEDIPTDLLASLAGSIGAVNKPDEPVQ